MKLRLLSSSDLCRALPMRVAIEAAEVAFGAQASGEAVAPERLALGVEPAGGTTLVMPAHVPGRGLVSKVVSVFPGNAQLGQAVIQGAVLLLDEETGSPLALLDGAGLTALRTGAASGAASKWLAPPDCSVGALLGAGAQAVTQLQAMCCARTLEEVRVWSRSPGSARAFISRQADSCPARLRAVESPGEALQDAQLVSSVTPAERALFEVDQLAPGAHLNALGSFTPTMQEFPPELAGQARVFVDDRDAALEEAGELIAAVAAGHSTPEEWSLLGDVVRGSAPGRLDGNERTLFKSVGIAAQDATAAMVAYERACAADLGLEVEF